MSTILPFNYAEHAGLTHHLAWITREDCYLRKSQKDLCKVTLRSLCQDRDVVIMNQKIGDSFVYLKLSLGADTSLEEFVGELKTKMYYILLKSRSIPESNIWAEGFISFSEASYYSFFLQKYLRRGETKELS